MRQAEHVAVSIGVMSKCQWASLSKATQIPATSLSPDYVAATYVLLSPFGGNGLLLNLPRSDLADHDGGADDVVVITRRITCR
jgi:hypothetical protein